MGTQGLIGPYFFEDEHGKAETVNSEHYLVVLKKFKAALRRRRLQLQDQWFMQDGTTAHTARNSRQWLAESFGDRVISLKTDFPWSPHSPDLNPCDFFLWGYLKDRVYSESPATVLELKNSIIHHVDQLRNNVELQRRVMGQFQKRIRVCLNRQGCHIEHLL